MIHVERHLEKRLQKMTLVEANAFYFSARKYYMKSYKQGPNLHQSVTGAFNGRKCINITYILPDV